jgi:response regulator RpfG family c-di-GMP phosphodiesterase
MARILVVDDRVADREFLEYLLRYAGHEVSTAGDGEEALRAALVQSPDLAIVDIVMPTMDGLEFVKRLRADPKNAAVQVMFYSGVYLQSEAEQLAKEGKVRKILFKPAEPEAVLAAVNELVGTSSQKVQPAAYKPLQHDADPLVSVTLHKTQRELESISQRFALLVDLARDLTSIADPKHVLDRIATAPRSLIGVHFGILALLNDSGTNFERLIVSGLGAEKRLPYPYPRPDGTLYGRILSQQGVQRRRPSPPIEPTEFGLPRDCGPVVSYIAAPITGTVRVFGALCLINKLGTKDFTEEDERITQSIVAQASVSYENTRLIAETERRLALVNSLRAIDVAITASTDLSLTLDVVTDQVVTNLHVDAADVLTLSHGSNYLKPAAVRGMRSPNAWSRTEKMGSGAAGRAALERRRLGTGCPAIKETDRVPPPAIEGEHLESYFVAPLLSKGRTLGVIEAFHRSRIEPDDDWMRFFDALAGQAAIAIDAATLFGDLQRANTDLIQAYDSTLEGWVQALDLRDHETAGHTERVTRWTIELADSMGLREAELTHIRRGALLHDIGKLGIPDAILLKAGALTDDEWAIMRRHPTLAYEWLKPIAFLRPAIDIPYCHHEKWDGSGYPRGLSGENIPAAARMFAVADVWDALTSDRPYRKAWTPERTRAHLHEIAGTHLDPDIVAAFFRLPTVKEIGGRSNQGDQHPSGAAGEIG